MRLLQGCLLVLCCILAFSVFARANVVMFQGNQVFQVATIGAIMRGVYDSEYSYRALMKHGSQGIGTFSQLDGEMIALDGEYFQIKSDGRVSKVRPEQTTPFAEVVDFKPTGALHIESLHSLPALRDKVATQFENKNVPYAFRIDGEFNAITMRSLRKQSPPYVDLVAAAKVQAIFQLEHLKGTIIGFWFPNYFAGIAAPGFHMHFINLAHTIGGHVLSLDLSCAKLSFAPLYSMKLQLPTSKMFAAADLTQDHLAKPLRDAKG